jgi:transposase
MQLYNYFIGLDIGKFSFVVALHEEKVTKEYENNTQGIKKFLQDYEEILPTTFCVLETTGGYEKTLLLALRSNGYAVHRADTRKVKDFIRSYGRKAKTDSLDAKGLAHYGYDRHQQLDIYEPANKTDMKLFVLVMRKNDLTGMLVAEKNRLKAPNNEMVKQSCQKMISMLSEEIKLITEQINELIESSSYLSEKRKVLKSIPGIGDAVSCELLILLPELGMLDRRKIASLVGLAPQANDSGKYKGYRRTGYGRQGVKPKLFLAAMAARNSKSDLKIFYEKLISAGKRKMVALTALMRKILVIANARIRDFNKEYNFVKAYKC